MATPKSAIIVLIGLAGAAYLILDGQQYLSLSFFSDLYEQQPQLTALIYFLIYIAATGLSLPGAALLARCTAQSCDNKGRLLSLSVEQCSCGRSWAAVQW